MPRTSALITRVLEEEGVLGDVTISSYNLQFIPIADDVVSLENSEAFKEIWMVSSTFLLRHYSLLIRSLGFRMATRPPFMTPHRLCTLFKSYLGYFLGLLGKVTTPESVRRRDERITTSDILQRLADLLTRQTTQRVSVDQEGVLDISGTFDSLIVIDRRVDMITPLLTQLTYEGLIDEVIHIKNCESLANNYNRSLTYALSPRRGPSIAPQHAIEPQPNRVWVRFHLCDPRPGSCPRKETETPPVGLNGPHVRRTARS